jgi:hypothetical protein
LLKREQIHLIWWIREKKNILILFSCFHFSAFLPLFSYDVVLTRGVYGCGSIREPAYLIQLNSLFIRTHSFAGEIRSNPSYSQAIGSGIGFRFLNPCTQPGHGNDVFLKNLLLLFRLLSVMIKDEFLLELKWRCFIQLKC